MFKRLPDEGRPFTERDRDAWLTLLNASLDVLYPSPPPPPQVRVRMEREQAIRDGEIRVRAARAAERGES